MGYTIRNVNSEAKTMTVQLWLFEFELLALGLIGVVELVVEVDEEALELTDQSDDPELPEDEEPEKAELAWAFDLAVTPEFRLDSRLGTTIVFGFDGASGDCWADFNWFG